MSTPEEVLRRFLEEVWNAHDLEAFPRHVSPDVRFHPPRGDSKDHAQYLRMATEFLEAFPDIHFEVGPLVSQGDTAAVQLVITGTNWGPFRGREATGRTVRVEGRPWCRVADGRIVEFWQLFDELGMLHQLGHLTDATLLGTSTGK